MAHFKRHAAAGSIRLLGLALFILFAFPLSNGREAQGRAQTDRSRADPTPQPAGLEGRRTRPLKIVLFSAANPGVHWWRTSAELFQEACRQLGMKSEVIYMNRDRLAMLEKFRAMAVSADKPDAIVFPNIRQNAIGILEIAEQHNVKAFIYNSGLVDEANRKQYGGPRDYFTNWIGQILPNDRQAGADLAQLLYERARKAGLTNADGKVPFVCLNGPVVDPAAVERLRGLKEAAREIPNLEIQQIISCDWTRPDGCLKTKVLVKRYPGTRVIWSANDPMALGALTALHESGIEPGKEILIGSMDWDPEALKAVNQGEIVASIDGHFMEPAWAAVLLYDYFHGEDFQREALTFFSEMTLLDRENIQRYLAHFKPENFSKIHFASFSKALNPGLKRYHFDSEEILDQVSGESFPPTVVQKPGSP